MIKKKRKFEWPKKLYDKPRILEENKLVEKYGLKNKKEIWKAEAKIKYFRTRAKSLITADPEEQKKFSDKINKIGIKVENVTDVLSLNKEDLLKRRLPSVLVEKKLANTSKHARQLVVHKRVMISGNVINIPSYIVRKVEENQISVQKKIRKPKIKETSKSENAKNSKIQETQEKEENSGESNLGTKPVEAAIEVKNG